MSRSILFSGGALVLVLAVAAWRMNESSSSEVPFETKNLPPSPAPLCPWREPEADLKQFFPEADHYETETRILSGRRTELAARLGRQPTGDENALRLYRVCAGSKRVGTILTGRVKGECGAIELVVALEGDTVRGLRLQRHRETAAVAATLENPAWLRAFAGKSAGDAWKAGQDLAKVPAEARASADAIANGVRSLLILWAASENVKTAAAPHL